MMVSTYVFTIRHLRLFLGGSSIFKGFIFVQHSRRGFKIFRSGVKDFFSFWVDWLALHLKFGSVYF